ncbi:hypothetical protein P22_2015 [Propionispora sp. 2/2-37]|uniref:hypothetical protein n=1 Tax=Propionispora sp. 2/2-37 TaxID=1677858 RepID=UPI0006BFFE4A|nr:hypothetical protein [Propionispora sp. 2/2-37]CUH95927.1 hypothetical protein P22_2015 [Propionispora sp. 2/2-37]
MTKEANGESKLTYEIKKINPSSKPESERVDVFNTFIYRCHQDKEQTNNDKKTNE